VILLISVSWIVTITTGRNHRHCEQRPSAGGASLSVYPSLKGKTSQPVEIKALLLANTQQKETISAFKHWGEKNYNTQKFQKR
jgi:hypothetical protein